ncbi:hypothetical protein RDI58_018200 [Solanum bulbocastanum]|uniref:Uncharacterized protein n=1 Tax=Solanum bulbocastanum TaxID=147425 RepID=A0AAN8TBG1_SOLBU
MKIKNKFITLSINVYNLNRIFYGLAGMPLKNIVIR